DEDVPTSSESNVPSSANGAKLVAESVINTRSSAPADCSWKPDNSDAPKGQYIAPCYNFIDYTFIFGCVMIISMDCFLCAVPEGFTKVAETKFQMKVEEFFNLYFSDKAVSFIESFHRRCGDKGKRDTNGQREDCILRVYVNLAFSKRTVWKAHGTGKIVQSTLEECREAYATWIAMVPSVSCLDPSGSSIENGELHIKREVATEDPSERSHNSTDPVRTFQISDSSDVNQRIGNLWQGTKASSITYLLREVVRKSYGYLKAMVSIIVLLNRPQQVHVSYSVACMGRMGGGEGPWLEKRMHQLKEEMMMVEA
ncbi:hypothetical protein Gogos_009933, partial [Gossypium gossypioides]|nr:hypothetical protein [Gossypium gossypioides]